jgi:hypothetical protein
LWRLLGGTEDKEKSSKKLSEYDIDRIGDRGVGDGRIFGGYQQKHTAVKRFRSINAAHSGIGKVAVVSDIEPTLHRMSASVRYSYILISSLVITVTDEGASVAFCTCRQAV